MEDICENIVNLCASVGKKGKRKILIKVKVKRKVRLGNFNTLHMKNIV